jgi:hypothetical protein
MILYPTTILFRVARAMAGLKAGRPMPAAEAVDLDGFENIVGMEAWKDVEERFGKG